ncbi:MAG: aminodeoxychorismate/anthranilate synthase component II [Phycisphaerales bacterium]
MILLIDNYDSFTWNLVQRLGELDASLDVRVVRNDEITPDQAAALNPSHIIISPGPASPTEAGVSNDILTRFAGLVPILGVCLGHQCIGFTSGMTVDRAPKVMHGKTSPIHHDDQGVFAGLPNPFVATRYHSLCVLPHTVPDKGWTVSAWTDEPDDTQPSGTRRIVMGLRRNWSSTPDNERPSTLARNATPAPLEGVQFHPESFLTLDGPRLLANFLAMRAPSPAPSAQPVR